MYNFGWEYVWHCHLLGHEENDMMRPLVMWPGGDIPMGIIDLLFYSEVSSRRSVTTCLKNLHPEPPKTAPGAGAPEKNQPQIRLRCRDWAAS